MNTRELNTLLGEISSSCTQIASITSSAVINKNRSAKMGEYASLFKNGMESLTREKTIYNQRMADGVLLLSICLEDVKNFVRKFATLNKDLAVAIVKGGTHCLEFVKLTEQLQHCCVLVKLDIVIPAEDGFDQDCSDLLSRLPKILQLMFNESERSSLHSFVGKTRSLINNQIAIKKSYEAKRSRNDDVTMSSDDLALIKPIGKGGFSTVWLGKYKGQEVAIKVLSVESSNITIKEFQHEADLMRRLSNKNIVAYYGVTEIYNAKISGHCMIMEYMANDSLFTYIKNNRSSPLNWSRKVDIALDIASGIAFLHRLRIIHRDIKLGNILLDEHLHAKVADFGMSFAKTSANSTYNMNEGGTIPYMAPECFGMNAAYSTKSDVFAFAIVCWGLMHWELPFVTYDREAIREMVLKEKFRLPIDSKIPIALSSMIKLSWEQAYSHRPTMVEIKTFLEDVVFIDGIQADNPVFSTEMPTRIVPADENLRKPSALAVAPPPKSSSGISAVNNDNSYLKLLKSVSLKQTPKFSKMKKGLKNLPKLEGRNMLLLIALLVIIIVLCLSIGIYFIAAAGKSSSPPSTNSFTTRTISRTPFPTATVSILIQDSEKLANVDGITIDEDDNLYVVVPSTYPMDTPGFPLVYKIVKGNPLSAVLIANLSLDGQGSASQQQGICYFNQALYVPRMGQITKIDLARNNMITKFSGHGVSGAPKDGVNNSAVFFSASQCIASTDGTIYVGESNSYIRVVDQSGFVSTLATLPNGSPKGFAFSGNSLLVSSTAYNYNGMYVCKVDLNSRQITNIIGNFTEFNPSPVEGPSLSSRVFAPNGITFDELGNLYYIQTAAHSVWKMNTTNYVSLFAGSGSQTGSGLLNGIGANAKFDQPKQIVFDSLGRLFVTDQHNAAIRMINW